MGPRQTGVGAGPHQDDTGGVDLGASRDRARTLHAPAKRIDAVTPVAGAAAILKPAPSQQCCRTPLGSGPWHPV